MRRHSSLPLSVVESMRLPYPPYLWKIVRQSAILWILVRLLTFALHPAWITHVSLVALVACLVWWDRRRSHEMLLPANLGAPSGWFWAASIITATVLSIATATLLAVL
jgi:hypothetical protein